MVYGLGLTVEHICVSIYLRFTFISVIKVLLNKVIKKCCETVMVTKTVYSLHLMKYLDLLLIIYSLVFLYPYFDYTHIFTMIATCSVAVL